MPTRITNDDDQRRELFMYINCTYHAVKILNIAHTQASRERTNLVKGAPRNDSMEILSSRFGTDPSSRASVRVCVCVCVRERERERERESRGRTQGIYCGTYVIRGHTSTPLLTC